MKALHTRRSALALTAALTLPLSLTACSDGYGNSAAGAGTGSSEASAPTPEAAVDPLAGPFGPACSAVPRRGAGSFNGMAADPFATAASHNPALSTLAEAVKKADLFDTLNNAQNITVFAPTDDAFAKLSKAGLDTLLTDRAALTRMLTYHVVGRKLTPEQLAHGSFSTLEKGELRTSGSGVTYTVNTTSKVVCGNVTTANATVYLVDTVLTPAR
ncbi:fasciclin domain-containing protein [Streptomyces sp. NPDC001478]